MILNKLRYNKRAKKGQKIASKSLKIKFFTNNLSVGVDFKQIEIKRKDQKKTGKSLKIKFSSQY